MPTMERPFLLPADDPDHYLINLTMIEHLAGLFARFYPDEAGPLPGWHRLTDDAAPVHIWTNGLYAIIPGTNSWSDWRYNLDARYRTEAPTRHRHILTRKQPPLGLKYHKGFWRAASRVIDAAARLNREVPLICHSFGSAVGTLLTVLDKHNHKGRVVVALAPPNTMAENTARWHGGNQRQGIDPFIINVMADDDLVTKVPPWMYKPGVEVHLPGALGINDHGVDKYAKRLKAVVDNRGSVMSTPDLFKLRRDDYLVDISCC